MSDKELSARVALIEAVEGRQNEQLPPSVTPEGSELGYIRIETPGGPVLMPIRPDPVKQYRGVE